MDIAAERGHLALLQPADLPFGIEQHHLDARHAVKPVRHGAARVARRSRQNHQFFAGTAHQTDHPPHEARTVILECERRAVEELQRIAAADTAKRQRKVVDPLHLPPQETGVDVVTEKSSARYPASAA